MAQVMRNPQFLRLWIAQMVSIFGDFVALFAVQIAITFRMHGTAKDVTGVMVAFATGFLYQSLSGSFENTRHVWVLIGLLGATQVLVDGQRSTTPEK